MDDGPGTWRLAVKQAASLGGIGLLAGAAAGWLALLGAQDVADRAVRAAAVYPALFLLLPAALLLWWLPARQAAAAGPRPALGSTAVLSFAAGLAGAVLAGLAFVAVATQVVSVFGRTNPGQFQGAVTAAIGFPVAGGLAALVAAVALVLALWAVGRGGSRAG